MPKLELEPIPKQYLPKNLRRFPDPVAMEMYSYRVVRRGPACVFYREYEDAQRARIGRKGAAFQLPGLVLFFAKAAGMGILQNLAYAAFVRVINRIRRPKKELDGKGLRLEAVASRRIYNRVRRENHPGTKASRTPAPKLEEKLETQYRLMVKLTRTPR